MEFALEREDFPLKSVVIFLSDSVLASIGPLRVANFLSRSFVLTGRVVVGVLAAVLGGLFVAERPITLRKYKEQHTNRSV